MQKGFWARAVQVSAAKKNFADYLIIKLKLMKQQTSQAPETMVKRRDIIDYTVKAIYVGIDVHQKDYQVAKLVGKAIRKL